MLDNAVGAALDPLRHTAVLTLVDDDTASGAQCSGGAETLCLMGGRFKVELVWQDFASRTGRGQTIALSDRSGLFWFFERSNVEVLFKMVDACDLTGTQWVFASATTNLGLDIVVTDTASGRSKTYRNALGQTADSIQDTGFFNICN